MLVCLLTFGNTKFTLPYFAASFAAFADQPPEYDHIHISISILFGFLHFKSSFDTYRWQYNRQCQYVRLNSMQHRQIHQSHLLATILLYNSQVDLCWRDFGGFLIHYYYSREKIPLFNIDSMKNNLQNIPNRLQSCIMYGHIVFITMWYFH